MGRRGITRAIAFGLALATGAGGARADDLQGQMGRMFDVMVNTTSPGAYRTQTRGVLSGGSAVVRGRIANEPIMSVRMPSFRAGCGGIDLYGGALSFIDLQAFEDLLRNSTQALGFLFVAAIKTMLPDVAAIMSDIQQKVQQLNQLFSNSCQLARGVATGGAFTELGKITDFSSTWARIEGLVSDDHQGRTASSGQTVWERFQANLSSAASQQFETTINGNLVWKALKSRDAQAWYTNGNEDLLQDLMSVTGTIIVRPPTMQGGKEAQGPGMDPPLPAILSFKQLVTGGQVDVYRCDNRDVTGCLNPVKQPQSNFRGFEQMVLEQLIGGGGKRGLVMAYYQAAGQSILNNAVALTSEEQNFQANIPRGYGALLQRLMQMNNLTGATGFARDLAPHIAHDMALILIDDTFRVVRGAVAATEPEQPFRREMLESLDQRHAALRQEAVLERARIGSESSIIQHFQGLLSLQETVRYSASR